MKKWIPLLLCLLILAACKVSNRIIQMDEPNKEMKTIRLVQTPQAYLSGEPATTGSRRKLKVSSTYLFDEQPKGHPEITATISISPSSPFNVLYSVMSFNFDGETIKLISEDQVTNGRFIVPENLWVSFVHSQKILGKLQSTNAEIEIEWNQSEKNKLSGFFKLAINQREVQFPAVPEGKKKW